jgi:transposase
MSYQLPPDEFVQTVLHLYHFEGWPQKEIARYFDVGVDVINRILKQYQQLKEKPIQFIEDTSKIKKLKIKELDDKVRLEKEKITAEDLEDLKLDIRLFERGHEPDDKDEENSGG